MNSPPGTVIVYLNNDAFAVNRADYLNKVAEANGNWIEVTTWIEAVGTFIGTRPRNPNCCLPLEGTA